MDQVSIWASFDNMLKDAEAHFFQADYERAIALWQDYARITGSTEWHKNHQDLQTFIHEFQQMPPDSHGQFFSSWLKLRQRMRSGDLAGYVYNLIQKFYARVYLESKPTVGFDLATGIFCFIEERHELAIQNLENVIQRQPDNLLGRLYMSRAKYAQGDVNAGASYLTQALFLSGTEILPVEIESSDTRELYQRLSGLHSKPEIGIWMTPFEAWYKNWTDWHEDKVFFQIMQQKERNERILQVKYYLAERYRHFMRCLFIAEYVRNFLPRERGLIWEQESYMEKLDSKLFERYRKKRKPTN
jgi:hypothetical protein